MKPDLPLLFGREPTQISHAAWIWVFSDESSVKLTATVSCDSPNYWSWIWNLSHVQHGRGGLSSREKAVADLRTSILEEFRRAKLVVDTLTPTITGETTTR